MQAPTDLSRRNRLALPDGPGSAQYLNRHDALSGGSRQGFHDSWLLPLSTIHHDVCPSFIPVRGQPCGRQRLLEGDHVDLSVANREDRLQVVNVAENKVQVSHPAGTLQEIDTPADQAL